MAQFEPVLKTVLQREEGLVDNPDDPGGITNMGISLRFLKSLPADRLRVYAIHDNPVTADTIRGLTLLSATAIYRCEFWNITAFDMIVSQDLCNEVFDAGVNQGIGPAIKCLQRAVWSINGNRRLLVDDGVLGSVTLGYVNQADKALIAPFRSERAAEYRLIAQASPAQRADLDGWLSRSYGVAPHWSK